MLVTLLLFLLTTRPPFSFSFLVFCLFCFRQMASDRKLIRDTDQCKSTTAISSSLMVDSSRDPFLIGDWFLLASELTLSCNGNCRHVHLHDSLDRFYCTSGKWYNRSHAPLFSSLKKSEQCSWRSQSFLFSQEWPSESVSVFIKKNVKPKEHLNVF